MRHCDQDLAPSRIIDAVITRMNRQYGLPSLFEVFREPCLDFGGNLIDKSLRRGDIDNDSFIIVLQDLLDCIETGNLG